MARSKPATRPIVPGFVLRPTVALAVPWVYVCTNWFIFILITAKYTVTGSAEYESEGPIAGLLSNSGLAVITAGNALFLAALCVEARVAWRLQPCVGRSQLAGVVFCAINVALLQWGAILAHDPFFGT